MLFKQIIEFELREPGTQPYMCSYNWLLSWQKKNL